MYARQQGDPLREIPVRSKFVLVHGRLLALRLPRVSFSYKRSTWTIAEYRLVSVTWHDVSNVI